MYKLFCEEEDNSSNILATILVGNVSLSRSNETDRSQKYIELLYIHVAIMGAVFGVLFPVGAFLAYHQITLAHKFTQPIGIAMALVGFVMVVVYVQLSHGDHFRYLIHGVIGLALLIMVLFVMPLLLVSERSRKWHHKVGHIIVFFGMGNILLVSLVCMHICMYTNNDFERCIHVVKQVVVLIELITFIYLHHTYTCKRTHTFIHSHTHTRTYTGFDHSPRSKSCSDNTLRSLWNLAYNFVVILRVLPKQEERRLQRE